MEKFHFFVLCLFLVYYLYKVLRRFGLVGFWVYNLVKGLGLVKRNKVRFGLRWYRGREE